MVGRDCCKENDSELILHEEIQKDTRNERNGSSCPNPTCDCSTQSNIQPSLPDLDQSFVIGSIDTPVGSLPRMSSKLRWCDRWGSCKARWGVGRMDYSIKPGLYALGNPDERSSVLVSANYKMSFDRLRKELDGKNVWILVLDTEGINV